MDKKSKGSQLNWSMLFLFSANVFFVILLVLAVIITAGFIVYRLGNYEYVGEFLIDGASVNWVASILRILLIVSIVIGISVIIGANTVIFRPMREIVSCMSRLANGDFDVRVNLIGRFYPNEVKSFSESFNLTAQELGSVELLRQDFVNDFSHEFKTPIVSIGGFAQLILEGNLSEEKTQEYLKIIVSESGRLSSLATNVLNLTKIETQAIITEKSTFNVSEQVRRAVLLLESKLEEKEIDLDLEVGEIEYYGNAPILDQLWVNVLDNAIKFSPKGGAISVNLFDFYDSIVFKVIDKGSGMSQDTVAHIFDKFYQSDASRTTQGNGLGMTLVKKIVSLHEGEIEVDSHLGQGTMITVALPKNESRIMSG